MKSKSISSNSSNPATNPHALSVCHRPVADIFNSVGWHGIENYGANKIKIQWLARRPIRGDRFLYRLETYWPVHVAPWAARISCGGGTVSTGRSARVRTGTRSFHLGDPPSPHHTPPPAAWLPLPYIAPSLLFYCLLVGKHVVAAAFTMPACSSAIATHGKGCRRSTMKANYDLVISSV